MRFISQYKDSTLYHDIETFTLQYLLNIYLIFCSCNMGTSDLPDMYARSPRALWAYILGKSSSAHVTNIM